MSEGLKPSIQDIGTGISPSGRRRPTNGEMAQADRLLGQLNTNIRQPNNNRLATQGEQALAQSLIDKDPSLAPGGINNPEKAGSTEAESQPKQERILPNGTFIDPNEARRVVNSLIIDRSKIERLRELIGSSISTPNPTLRGDRIETVSNDPNLKKLNQMSQMEPDNPEYTAHITPLLQERIEEQVRAVSVLKQKQQTPDVVKDFEFAKNQLRELTAAARTLGINLESTAPQTVPTPTESNNSKREIVTGPSIKQIMDSVNANGSGKFARVLEHLGISGMRKASPAESQEILLSRLPFKISKDPDGRIYMEFFSYGQDFELISEAQKNPDAVANSIEQAFRNAKL